MKKKLGISLTLMLGLLLVGCADAEENEGGSANSSAGSGGQVGQNTDQSAGSQQTSESVLDREGNLAGTIVSIQNNQMIIAPVTHAEISDEEDAVGDFVGDESDWITVTINEDTTFIRYHIARGMSQGSEPTTFNDLFVDDSVRIVGELTGNTVVATEVTVLAITH